MTLEISHGVQARSGRPKTSDSETVPQAIDANPVSSIQRTTGKFGIHSSVWFITFKTFANAELCLTYYQNSGGTFGGVTVGKLD